MKRLLAIFAHPDDEAFGPGGTIAYYAKKGVKIHLLCATRGEAGEIDKQQTINNKASFDSAQDKQKTLGEIRESELRKSAGMLGIEKVEFLGYKDGELRNAIYHKLADTIIKKINDFKPQVILTNERRGVSGHLDHIAVSMITTYAYLKTEHAKKLYYYCLSREITNTRGMTDYFIYFPEGYEKDEITTKIDYSCCWDTKKKAMKQHKSQMKDVQTLIRFYSKWAKEDNFILQFHRRLEVNIPETDLFAGF